MNPWHIESLSIYIVHIFVLVYSALIELFCFLDVIFGKFAGDFHKMSSTGWWHTSSPWLPSMLHAMAWSVRPLGNCETWPWCWKIRKNHEKTCEKLQTQFDLLKIWGDWGAGEATWKAIWHKVANMTIGCYEELPAVAVSNFPTSILSTSCRGWASGPNGSTRSITRIIRGRLIFTTICREGGSGYRFLIIMFWLILLSCLRMRITNQQDGRYMIGCSWRFIRKNLAKRDARPPKVVEPTLQSSKQLKDMFVLINDESSFFIRTPSLFPLPLSLYHITKFLMTGESQWGLAAFFFGINSWFMAAVPIAVPIFAWLSSSPAFAPVRWAHSALGLER